MRLYDDEAGQQEDARVSRFRKLQGYVGGIEIPTAEDVALALTKDHVGGEPVGLPALLVKAGLAADLDEGQRVAKSRAGRDVVDVMRALKWAPVRGRAREWRPPHWADELRG